MGAAEKAALGIATASWSRSARFLSTRQPRPRIRRPGPCGQLTPWAVASPRRFSSSPQTGPHWNALLTKEGGPPLGPPPQTQATA